jgi:hypothetical protein
VWLKQEGEPGALELADLFCSEARRRVRAGFRNINQPLDTQRYRTAMNVLDGAHVWLERI